MRIVKEVPKGVKNFLKTSRISKPLYSYQKDGIYVMFGPLEGKNISKLYIEDSELVERFIENIFEADSASIKVIMDTVEVYKDLKNNYYNYEL